MFASSPAVANDEFTRDVVDFQPDHMRKRVRHCNSPKSGSTTQQGVKRDTWRVKDLLLDARVPEQRVLVQSAADQRVKLLQTHDARRPKMIKTDDEVVVNSRRG